MSIKLSRKEQRKEERKAKAQRKALYYAKKTKKRSVDPPKVIQQAPKLKKVVDTPPVKEEHLPSTEPSLPAKMITEEKRQFPAVSEIGLLERRINGIMNRLSLQNLSLHVKTITELLQSNSKSLVSEVLSRSICEFVSCQKNLLDGFIATLASFVSLLSFTEMNFLGADVVEECIRKLDSDTEIETDGRLQIISLTCYLYCYGIITSKAILDLLAEWIASPDIINVEFTLRALRITAVRLRKEDSQIFFNTVSAILEHSSKLPKDQWTSRFKFLVESVQDLKNNKHCYKISSEVEEIQHQFTNLIKNMGIIKLPPLNVGLADFRSGQSSGRWWKVGAAWKNAAPKRDEEKQLKVSGKDELAARLGLSSGLRKNVLTILLTCEDYNDAFLKLCNLKLSNFQQREVASIIVRCCLREESYNPFYGFLLSKLCDNFRDYSTILKCIFWDFKLEESEPSVKVAQISKASCLYAFLLTRRKIKFDILKKFAFESLNSKSISFLAFFLHKVFQMAQSDSDVSLIFSNSSSKKGNKDEVNSTFTTFRRGLRFFLTKLFPSLVQKLCRHDEKLLIDRRISVALTSLED